MELSPAAGLSRRRRDLREDDGERRPLAQFRLDLDRAAMGVHDALREREAQSGPLLLRFRREERLEEFLEDVRSEEHTSELQSPYDLVCRLLLEKKNVLFVTSLLLRAEKRSV